MTTAVQYRANNYFLFARPSFWAGAGQIMDFGNSMIAYNVSPTPELADYFAMKNDWMLVAKDIRHAIHLMGADQEQQPHLD